jgi:hypothetical protein
MGKKDIKIWNQVVEIYQKEYDKLYENWFFGRTSFEVTKQANDFLVKYKPLFHFYNVYYYNFTTIKTFLQLQQLLSAAYVLKIKISKIE